MPTIQIITADERMRERRGVKALLLGQVAVGKTWQLHTLDAARTLLLDAEAGDLSARDVPVDVIRLDDWPTARDVAPISKL